jgi:hypothetical protein
MADNTLSSPSGDSIRDVQRTTGGPKTTVVQLDVGGSNANSEVLVTSTSYTQANALPVGFTADQLQVMRTDALAIADEGNYLATVGAMQNGFIPFEFPAWMYGVVGPT